MVRNEFVTISRQKWIVLKKEKKKKKSRIVILDEGKIKKREISEITEKDREKRKKFIAAQIERETYLNKNNCKLVK
jgi:hypothetical protein